MKRSGPPLKLDEARQKDLLAILALGCSRRVAAKYVGCSTSTISRLAQRDKDFALCLKQAEGRREVTQLGNIHSASRDQWRAAAWLLERIYPDRYARRRPGTITAEQISQLLGQFAELLAEEIEDESCRKRIFQRLQALTRGLMAEKSRDGK